jgi:hypothetical protein
MSAPIRTIALGDIAHTIALAGWRVDEIDVDLVAGRLLVRLFRSDGRFVELAADHHGRARLDRFQRERVIERCFGDGPEREGFRDQFLGRTRFEGPRSGLRGLCAYVGGNPAPGFLELPPAAVRHAFRRLLWDRQVAPLLEETER